MVKNEEIMEKYKHISDTNGESVQPYGVILLSKYPMKQLRTIPLESDMGRDFLLGDYEINGKLVGIGSVHLESLSSKETRKIQLQTIAATLSKGYDHWIVMGDFNFDNEINFGDAPLPLENDMLQETMPTAIDTWFALNKNDKSSGKTYDSTINKMLQKYERMRYDRVMLNSKDPLSQDWIQTNAKLIGTEPIIPGADIWPSDHFGVYVEFTCK